MRNRHGAGRATCRWRAGGRGSGGTAVAARGTQVLVAAGAACAAALNREGSAGDTAAASRTQADAAAALEMRYCYWGR